MGTGHNGDALSQGESILFLTPNSALNHCVKLVTVDENKTVVAEFHRAHYVRKKQKARLEIHPAGMDMLDHIVLTFVFVEDKRRQREARATWDIAGVI